VGLYDDGAPKGLGPDVGAPKTLLLVVEGTPNTFVAVVGAPNTFAPELPKIEELGVADGAPKIEAPVAGRVLAPGPNIEAPVLGAPKMLEPLTPLPLEIPRVRLPPVLPNGVLALPKGALVAGMPPPVFPKGELPAVLPNGELVNGGPNGDGVEETGTRLPEVTANGLGAGVAANGLGACCGC